MAGFNPVVGSAASIVSVDEPVVDDDDTAPLELAAGTNMLAAMAVTKTQRKRRGNFITLPLFSDIVLPLSCELLGTLIFVLGERIFTHGFLISRGREPRCRMPLRARCR
jgi:hypothetical protein